jgi:hypothetical protein
LVGVGFGAGRDAGRDAGGGAWCTGVVLGLGLGVVFGGVGVLLGLVVAVLVTGGAGDDRRVAETGDRACELEPLHAPTTPATIAIDTAIPHRTRTLRIADRVIVDLELSSSHDPFSPTRVGDH